MSDPDLIEARVVISTLQTSLDRLQARIRDNERIIGELNERLAEQTECRDRAEIRLAMIEAAAHATRALADAPPLVGCFIETRGGRSTHLPSLAPSPCRPHLCCGPPTVDAPRTPFGKEPFDGMGSSNYHASGLRSFKIMSAWP